MPIFILLIRSKTLYCTLALSKAAHRFLNILYRRSLTRICTSIIDTKNTEGDTPLIIASKRNNGEAIEALLAAGADIKSVNSSNRLAISYVRPNNKGIFDKYTS